MFFDERKAIRNARNIKSEYLAIQCRIEYEGKKALNYGSFEEYSKHMKNISTEYNQGMMDNLKIFVSHSESDVDIAEKLIELLLSSLEVKDEEIRCSSVPGHMLKFGTISKIIKDDLIKNPSIIFIVTRKSLMSQWVMFELGASWIKELTIIPIIGPGLSYKDLPGPLSEQTNIEIQDQNAKSRLMDAIKQISDEKDIKVKSGGKQINCLDIFIKTFQDTYQHLSSCHKMYEKIVYKIISCIMQLKALNQHATATKVAKQIDSSPEVVLTHLKYMHDDKLVTFPTVDGFGLETNFQLSEPAFKYILQKPILFENTLKRIT